MTYKKLNSIAEPLHNWLDSQTILEIVLLITLFGQTFLSIFAFQVDISNRLIMLIMRGALAFIGAVGVSLVITQKNKIRSLSIPFIAIIIFWLQYFTRLCYGVIINGVSTAIPIWELLSWGFGSSLILSTSGYFLIMNSKMISWSKNLTYKGVIIIGLSGIFYGINPGYSSPYFGLPHLNQIPSGHAAASLTLLGFSLLISNSLAKMQDKLITLIAILIGLFLTAYSGTRAAGLSLIIPFISLILSKDKINITYNRKLIYKFSLISLITVLITYLTFVSPSIKQKILNTGFDPNSVQRLRMINLSISEFLKNPIIGSGFEVHTNIQNLASLWGESIFYPHNYLIESVALGGILMGGCLLYAWSYAYLNIVKAVSDDLNSLWILFLFIQATVYVMFSGHLGDVPIFWLVLGIGCGLKKSSLNKLNTN